MDCIRTQSGTVYFCDAYRFRPFLPFPGVWARLARALGRQRRCVQRVALLSVNADVETVARASINHA